MDGVIWPGLKRIHYCPTEAVPFRAIRTRIPVPEGLSERLLLLDTGVSLFW